jgi:hypothetical protein
MTQVVVRVERDPLEDAGWVGWRVVVEGEDFWAVQYRGDLAECEDKAEEIRAAMNQRPT